MSSPNQPEPFFCPGFKIPSLDQNFSVYNQYGPRVQVDYRPFSNRIITKLCDHSKCQPAAEFEYAMIKLFLNGEVSLQQWKVYRPQHKPNFHGNGLPCYGEMVLKFNNIDMDKIVGAALDEVITPCTHQGYNCRVTLPAPVALCKLLREKQIPEQVLEEIISEGWYSKMLHCSMLNIDFREAICEASQFNTKYTWRPYEMEDWEAIQDAEDKRQIGLAQGKTLDIWIFTKEFNHFESVILILLDIVSQVLNVTS